MEEKTVPKTNSWGHPSSLHIVLVLFFHSQNVRDVCMSTCVSCNNICSSPSQPKYEKVDHGSKTFHIRSLSSYSSIANSDLRTWHHLMSNCFCLPCHVILLLRHSLATVHLIPLSKNKTLGPSFGIAA